MKVPGFHGTHLQACSNLHDGVRVAASAEKVQRLFDLWNYRASARLLETPRKRSPLPVFPLRHAALPENHGQAPPYSGGHGQGCLHATIEGDSTALQGHGVEAIAAAKMPLLK